MQFLEPFHPTFYVISLFTFHTFNLFISLFISISLFASKSQVNMITHHNTIWLIKSEAMLNVVRVNSVIVSSYLQAFGSNAVVPVAWNGGFWKTSKILRHFQKIGTASLVKVSNRKYLLEVAVIRSSWVCYVFSVTSLVTYLLTSVFVFLFACVSIWNLISTKWTQEAYRPHRTTFLGPGPGGGGYPCLGWGGGGRGIPVLAGGGMYPSLPSPPPCKYEQTGVKTLTSHILRNAGGNYSQQQHISLWLPPDDLMVCGHACLWTAKNFNM